MHRFFAFRKNGTIELFDEDKKHFKVLRIEKKRTFRACYRRQNIRS